MAKKLTVDQLRAFRSAVARLKKAGLIQPGVDARKASPESRSLTGAVKRFGTVVRGQAASLKLSRLNLSEREAIARNMQVAKPIGMASRIIVPKFRDENVSIKSRAIKFHSPEGIRRLELPPVRTDSTAHFLQDLKASKIKLPDKRKGEKFAARLYSGQTRPYTSLRTLLDELSAYNSIVGVHGRKQTSELLRNIEIFTVSDNRISAWDNLKKTYKASRERGKSANKKTKRVR